MSPEEVVQALQKINIPVSVPTLARYVRLGLVSVPERGGHGRGGGKWTEYQVCAPIEAATAWKMLNGKTTIPNGTVRQVIRFSPELIKDVRESALAYFYSSARKGRRFFPKEIVREEDAFQEYMNEKTIEAWPSLPSEEEVIEILEKGEAEDAEILADRMKKEKVSIPDWFPAGEWISGQAEIKLRFVSVVRVIYFYEYGLNLLRLFSVLQNIEEE